MLKTIRQSIDNNVAHDTLLDKVVDAQKPVRAIRAAQYPTKDGEELGNTLIESWKETTNIMKKLKEKLKVFFERSKGYLLTAALSIVTFLEWYGNYIVKMFGDALIIKTENAELNLLVVIFGLATIVVSALSDKYTKEERQQLAVKGITAIASGVKVDDELVIEKINARLKEIKLLMKDSKKELTSLTSSLHSSESSLANAKNNYSAVEKMYNMFPKLASAEDVQNAANAIADIGKNIDDVKCKIENCEATMKMLNDEAALLKSKL